MAGYDGRSVFPTVARNAGYSTFLRYADCVGLASAENSTGANVSDSFAVEKPLKEPMFFQALFSSVRADAREGFDGRKSAPSDSPE